MRHSLHAKVVDALGSRIVAGEVGAGQTFTVAELEGEFGISRSVAREVVRVMESLGLVVSRTKVGCTVQDASAWNVLAPQVIAWQLKAPTRTRSLASLIELRAGIEPMAARLAARRATWEQVNVLMETAARMAELGRRGLGTSPAFLEADELFHNTVLRATGNPAYAALGPTVEACLHGRNASGMTPASPAEANLRRHCDLADAIARRDEAAAGQLAHEIVSEVSDEVDL